MESARHARQRVYPEKARKKSHFQALHDNVATAGSPKESIHKVAYSREAKQQRPKFASDRVRSPRDISFQEGGETGRKRGARQFEPGPRRRRRLPAAERGERLLTIKVLPDGCGHQCSRL